MWVSKTSELIGSSTESFEAAARSVIGRAHKTLRGIRGFTVLEKRMAVAAGGDVEEYRVRLQLHFDVAPAADLHW